MNLPQFDWQLVYNHATHLIFAYLLTLPICKPFSFEGMVDAAFNTIRQNSQSVAAVSIHLLETISTIAAQTHITEYRAALLRHATLAAHGCKEKLSANDDYKDLEKRYEAAVKASNGKPASIPLNAES